jgi:hypothetical protein
MMMKKFLIIGSVVGIVLIALGAAGFAYAQAQVPPTPPTTQPGYWGMMGGARSGGMMGRMGGMHVWWNQGSGNLPGQPGPMHPFMIAALADKLGLGADELQAKIDAGETPWQVAKNQGLTDEEIATLFAQAHETALQQVVAAGVITQEQADWMAQHMQQRQYMRGGFGIGRSGPCHGGRFTQP